MKKLIFEIAGRTLSGFAKTIDDQLWVHFEGKTFCISTQTQRKDSRKAGVKSGNITAPMPGKITKSS